MVGAEMLLYFEFSEADDVARNVLIFFDILSLNVVIKKVVTQPSAGIWGCAVVLPLYSDKVMVLQRGGVGSLVFVPFFFRDLRLFLINLSLNLACCCR